MTSLNLRTIRLRPGESYETDVPVEVEPLLLGGQRYELVPAEAQARVRIARMTSGTIYELSFEVELHGPCFRCLEDAAVTLQVNAQEIQGGAGAASEELATPYVAEERLELSAWARDALALELPEKILCRDECAGLCGGCGANLNTEACTCPPPEPDVRFSKLAELRDKL